MPATMDGYEFNWSTGAERLLLVSLGTGKANPAPSPTSGFIHITAAQGVLALKAMMEDASDLVEILMR